MAKTKRRSCKGGRKSRKCRGGTKYSYNSAYNIPYSASSKERGFGSHPQGTSHISERYSLNPFSGIAKKLTPNPRTVDRALLAVDMAPSRAKRTIGRAVSRTASAARGLGASTASAANRLRASVGSLAGRTASTVSRMGNKFKRMFDLPHKDLDESKLRDLDLGTTYGLSENAANHIFRIEPDGKLYKSGYNGPVGFLKQGEPVKTARFYPEHMPKKDETWYIRKYNY